MTYAINCHHIPSGNSTIFALRNRAHGNSWIYQKKNRVMFHGLVMFFVGGSHHGVPDLAQKRAWKVWTLALRASQREQLTKAGALELTAKA